MEFVCQAVPGDLASLNTLAWILATCPDDAVRDGERAVVLARRLVAAREPPSPFHLDTLAAAYAETGRFEEAMAVMEQVLERLRRLAAYDVGRFEQRLDGYRRRLPCRDLPGVAP